MEVHFVPLVVVHVWRVMVWCSSLALLGSVGAFLPRAWRARHDGVLDELMPRWTLDAYIALAIFIFQGCVAQAIRWDQPLMLQGLPLTTAAIAWCLVARARRSSARI